jgi:O-antigen/teichoic acid export membrane protein
VDAKLLGRLRTGFSANVYNQAITIVVQLVGVPILLHAWGAQLYGEWLILSAIPVYLSITDLGFSQSAGNEMTSRVARADRVGALAVFQSLGMLVYGLAVAGLALSALMFWHLPLDRWFSNTAIDGEIARWVLMFFAAEVFVRMLEGVNHAGFRAGGDYALHVGLHSTVRLLQFSGVWFVALAGGGVVGAAAAFFGVRALTTPAFAMFLIYRHRWLSFGFLHARRDELRRLIRPALANVALPLAHALNIQGMVLVVGAVLGPLAVVVFSTLRTLTRLALQLVLAVSHAAEPELATAYGTRHRELLQSLFVHAMRLGLWLAMTAAVSLVLFGSVILDLWTHGKVSMQYTLFGWLLGSAVASVLWYGPLTVLKAANLHLRAACLFVLASAGAVGLSVLLLRGSGNIANAGLALLIMDATMALYTFHAAARFIGANPTACIKKAVDPRPLVTIALARIRTH